MYVTFTIWKPIIYYKKKIQGNDLERGKVTEIELPESNGRRKLAPRGSCSVFQYLISGNAIQQFHITCR